MFVRRAVTCDGYGGCDRYYAPRCTRTRRICAATRGSDDFPCEIRTREAFRCICQTAERRWRHVFPAGLPRGWIGAMTLAVEGSCIGCTKCSGSLGFRDGTRREAQRRASRVRRTRTVRYERFRYGETPSSGMTVTPMPCLASSDYVARYVSINGKQVIDQINAANRNCSKSICSWYLAETARRALYVTVDIY